MIVRSLFTHFSLSTRGRGDGVGGGRYVLAELVFRTGQRGTVLLRLAGSAVWRAVSGG